MSEPSTRQYLDALNVLEARTADMEAELLALRQRVVALEHGRIASQAAHNALVAHCEAQEHGQIMQVSPRTGYAP